MNQPVLDSPSEKIAIIKSDRLFCESLLETLKSKGHDVVGFATTFDEGIALITKLKPIIIIVGAELGNKFGVDIIEFTRQNNLPIKSIVYSRSKRDNLFDKAMMLNVNGFIFLEAGLAELMHCLSEVKEGRNYISPSAFQVAVDSVSSDIAMATGLTTLTKREIEIMKLVAKGLTNQDIADALSRSIATINNHRQNIMRKLNITGYNQLLRQAYSSSVRNKHYNCNTQPI